MVSDAVNVDKVKSLLKMICHRRRFLRMMEEKRISSLNGITGSLLRSRMLTRGLVSFAVTVPHIIVDSQLPESPHGDDISRSYSPTLSPDSPLRPGFHGGDENLAQPYDRMSSRRYSGRSMLSESGLHYS